MKKNHLKVVYFIILAKRRALTCSSFCFFIALTFVDITDILYKFCYQITNDISYKKFIIFVTFKCIKLNKPYLSFSMTTII